MLGALLVASLLQSAPSLADGHAHFRLISDADDQRVEDNRRSVVTPVVLLSVAGLGTLTGAVLLYGGGLTLFAGSAGMGTAGSVVSAAGLVLVTIGVVVIVVAVVFAVVGAVKLVRLFRGPERASPSPHFDAELSIEPPPLVAARSPPPSSMMVVARF